MITSGTLTPAYGRDYKTIQAIKDDFIAGKDFVLNTFEGNCYCSIADCAPGVSLIFRYGNSRKVCSFKVPKT